MNPNRVEASLHSSPCRKPGESSFLGSIVDLPTIRRTIPLQVTSRPLVLER